MTEVMFCGILCAFIVTAVSLAPTEGEPNLKTLTNIPSISYHSENILTIADCSFQYTEQPPHSLTCNPYTNETVQITITCKVVKLNDDLCCYIAWFAESAGTVRPLVFGHSISEGTNFVQSRLAITPNLGSKFCNKIKNGSKFWCQVVNTTGGAYQPLMKSNVFELMAPEDYNDQRCPTTVMETKTTCADVPTSSPTSSSTSQEFYSLSPFVAPSATQTLANIAMTSQPGVSSIEDMTTLFILPSQSGELVR